MTEYFGVVIPNEYLAEDASEEQTEIFEHYKKVISSVRDKYEGKACIWDSRGNIVWEAEE